jgi:hypothetical protein
VDHVVAVLVFDRDRYRLVLLIIQCLLQLAIIPPTAPCLTRLASSLSSSAFIASNAPMRCHGVMSRLFLFGSHSVSC